MAAKIKLAVAWYSEPAWHRLKTLVSDPDELDESYEEWLEAANDFMQQMKSRGETVEKVNVDPDTFIEWCRLLGKQPDRAARAEYATDLATQRDTMNKLLQPPVQISWKNK
jgi:hypothetical protein